MSIGEPVIINKNEISLILRQLGLNINPLSPLNNIINNLGQGAATLSNYTQNLINQPHIKKMFEIIAFPVVLVTSRIGGGSVAFEQMQLCYRKFSGDMLVSLLEISEENLSLQSYEPADAFFDWWCSNFACKNEQVTVNYIPPTITLDGLMTLFHTIDAFRRATYKNLLNYEFTRVLSISSQEFTETVHKALRSMDIRWLLPAFVFLVPGIGEYRLNNSPDNFIEAWNRNFLVTVVDKETGAESIGFGEAGRNMGMEFYRTWLMGAGFEIKRLTGDGIIVLSRFFIAPTSISNHFFELEKTKDETAIVNHQPYTYSQLVQKMKHVFSNAVKI
ncbi:MAG: hypothetical protein HPY74_02880 [Firmicutes bacterium]|nr:hypothetical protein [Bacillota bacterium]